MGAVEKPRSQRPRQGRLGVRVLARVARDRLVRGALRAVHRRRGGRAALALVVHVLLAVHGGATRRGRTGRGEGRGARRRRRSGRVRRLERVEAVRARQGAVPDRTGPAGALARARGRRVARRREADQGVARRRSAARRGALLLLRGVGRQARVRLPRQTAAAARRGGADRSVELPAADAGVEDRPGARVRQHGRAQAGRDHIADGAAVRRRLPPGAGAARRREHRHG